MCVVSGLDSLRLTSLSRLVSVTVRMRGGIKRKLCLALVRGGATVGGVHVCVRDRRAAGVLVCLFVPVVVQVDHLYEATSRQLETCPWANASSPLSPFLCCRKAGERSRGENI